MKKLLVSWLLVVGVAGAARAWPPRYGRREGYHALGVQVGGGISGLTGLANPALYRGSWQAGGFFNYTLNNTFSLRPAVLYAQRGGLVAAGGPLRRLHCLDMPLLLLINAHGYRQGGLVVEVGPQLGYQLIARDTPPVAGTDPVADTRPFDLGLAVGIGYQRKVGPYIFSARPGHSGGEGGLRSLRNVGGGLRYTAGLTTLGQAPTPGRETLRNGVLQLYLTYSLNQRVRN